MPLFPNSPFWLACDETWEGRRGVPFDWGGNRTYERTYKVIIRMKEMQAYAVCLCPALPLPGSFYIVASPSGVIEYDLLALLTRREAYPMVDHDWQVWIVKDTYTTQLPGTGPGGTRTNNPVGSSNDPTIELADVSWSFETKEEAPQLDLDGNPFVTTACMPFSPPFQAPVDYPVLTISRNELSFNHSKASQYARALNYSEFLGAPPGCVMSMPATSVQQNRGVMRYQRTTYRLMFRPQQKFGGYVLPKMKLLAWDTTDNGETYSWVRFNGVDGTGAENILDSWQPTLLMKGQFRLGTAAKIRENNFEGDMAGVVGRPVPIWRHGHQITTDMLLDDTGTPIDPVVEPGKVAVIAPWYKRFNYYRYINISALLVEGVG